MDQPTPFPESAPDIIETEYQPVGGYKPGPCEFCGRLPTDGYDFGGIFPYAGDGGPYAICPDCYREMDDHLEQAHDRWIGAHVKGA